MKLSYRYLQHLVDTPLSPENLADRLTTLGLEVRDMYPLASLEGVVVGKVTAIRRHPRADRLNLVEVDVGAEPLTLVCGAPNVMEGQYVPVARVGAKIAGGTPIHRAKVRGVVSPGMVCSERELGLGPNHSGILSLPFSAEPGADFVKALELGDTILDLEITANRGDCLSMLGLAREVSALTGNPLRFPPLLDETGLTPEAFIRVELKDQQLCPYYGAGLVRGVTVGPSPLWLWRAMYAMGGTPINNVVDITNLVLWELGQPLHAFDYHTLRDGRIVVRPAEAGERMITLDGAQRELDPEMLLICDGQQPVAIAGVMGGQETEVEADTTDVLLESAFFDPVSIRRTSRRLGLMSEASMRFERQVDPRGMHRALRRAGLLLRDCAGGHVAHPVIEAGSSPWAGRSASLRPHRVVHVLGAAPAQDTMESILTSLGFGVHRGHEQWSVEIPSFRADVSREIDLIEEIARFYGYDRIQSTLPPLRAEPSPYPPREQALDAMGDVLRSAGFFEVIGPSLEEEALITRARLPLEQVARVSNPISLQQEILRPHLFPRLLQILAYNLDVEPKGLRLFEVGHGFTAADPVAERKLLAAVSCGPEAEFLSAKGVLELVLDQLGLPPRAWDTGSRSFLEEGERADVSVNAQPLGFLGRVASTVTDAFGIEVPVYLWEIDLDRVYAYEVLPLPRFQDLPRFPAVHRDIALVVSRDVPAARLQEALHHAGQPWLESAELFDVYQGEKIPADAKSLAFSLVFRHPDRTLRDEEVDRIQRKITSTLKKQIGARLREE